MRTWKTDRLLGRPTMIGLLAITMVIASCASNDAGTRKAAVAKTVATDTAAAQQQKPVKLRYYGGPKSPMYPE
jgi:hypothetical protein